MSESDVVLLDSWVRKGDAEAFKVLAKRYAGMVYGTCKRILGNPAEAEDVAQECFEILATTRKPVGEYLAPWLHRVACNRSLTRLRSEHRRKEREAQFAAGLEAGREPVWDDIYGFVDEAIAQLPDPLRIPIVAHFLDDQTHSAIALTLGVPRSTITDHIDKGIELIRNTLKSRGVGMAGVVLAGLIKANVAQAAPSTLVAELGKIALAGPNVTAPVAAVVGTTLTGAVTAKIVGGLAALALVVIALCGGWRYYSQPYHTQDITAASQFRIEESAVPEKDSEAAASAAQTPAPTGSTPATADTISPSARKWENVGPRVHGIVLAEDRHPVPGVTVTITNRDEINEAIIRSKTRVMWPIPEELHWEAVTNTNGFFEFPKVPFRSRHNLRSPDTIVTEKGGLYAEDRITLLPPAQDQYFELVLRPAASIMGRVIDEEGKPVDNAMVSIIGTYASAGSSFVFSSSDGGFPLNGTPSERDGSFVLHHLAPGSYRMHVRAESFLGKDTEWIAAGETSLVVRLDRGLKLPAQIFDTADGRALPNIRVTAIPESHEEPRVACSATSDDNGRMLITGLQKGKYKIGIWASTPDGTPTPYLLPEPVEVTLEPGGAPRELAINATAGATVTGQVTDAATNLPMSSATVYLTNQKDSREAITNDKGCFAISGLPLGRLDASLGILGGGPRQRIPGIVEIKAYDQNAHINLRFTGADSIDFSECISGNVVDAEGKPVADAIIAFLGVGDATCEGTVSDSSGNFAATLSRANAAYLQAMSGYAISKVEGPVRKGSQNVVLKLFGGGVIEGDVVDTEGRPLAGAVVTVESEKDQVNLVQFRSSASVDWTYVSSLGFFHFGPLLPQTYPLHVYLGSDKEPALASTSASVQEGRVLRTRLVVDTSALATLEGTVTVDGEPGAGIPICEERGGRSCTDAEGYFYIPHLMPGPTEVFVEVLLNNAMSAPARRKQEITLKSGANNLLNFDITSGNAAVEGTVTINGRPEGNAYVSFAPLGASSGGNRISTSPNRDGYYNVTLQEGNYAVVAVYQDLGQSTEVQIEAGQTARVDFDLGGGIIEGVLAGLRADERAYIAVINGTVDSIVPSPDVLVAMDEQIKTSTDVTANGPFSFENLPQGQYTLGVVGVPADKDFDVADIADALQKGRYGIAYVKVIRGQTVRIELALP